MFKRNRIQKHFKKEMKKIEKTAKKQEKKGEGLFSNKIYKLNFYGLHTTQENKWKKVFMRLLNTIAGAIILLFVIMGVMFFCLLTGWGL